MAKLMGPLQNVLFLNLQKLLLGMWEELTPTQ